MEEWKAVVGYEGWYLVSNLGRVMRTNTGQGATPGRILKPATTRKGYLVVRLFKGTRSTAKDYCIHTLVAVAFNGPRPKRLEINHKDADKQNNTPDNLEYVTTQENIHHAIKLGLHCLPDNSGSNNGMSKLDEDIVRQLRLDGKKNRQERCLIANRLSVSERSIRDILNGRNWTHVEPTSAT